MSTASTTFLCLTHASKLLLLEQELNARAAVDSSIQSDKATYDNGHSSVPDLLTS